MLHLSPLLASKMFRNESNKDGAVRAIRMLEEAGIGKVTQDKPARGTSAVSFAQI